MIDLTIRDGTSQNDRFPDALREGYIQVDELAFEDLMAMGAEYARILKYYNLNNAHDGDWKAFFTSDEAVTMAMIRTVDLQKFEKDFFDARIRLSDMEGLEPTHLPNYRLAKKIDDWLKHLKQPQSEAGQALYAIIENVIKEKLARELLFLKKVLQPYDVRIAEKIEKDFDRCWFEIIDAQALPDFPLGRDDVQRRFKSNFYAFYNAVLALKAGAADHLPVSLKSRSHSSAIGLYVTFVKLFQKIQSQLNHFTQRHLNFYYNDILKAQPRPISADRTYLIFKPDHEERRVLIEKGTEFTAGNEANLRDVVYAAQNDVLVHGATVDALQTLYFDSDPLSSPEYELGFASRAKVSRIPILKTDPSTSEQELQAWPMFGALRSDTATQVYKDAEIGFAIASPVLFLKEGERHINVSFKMENTAAGGKKNLADILEKLTQIFGTNRQDAFFKAFRSTFKIYLTTEKGWLEIEEYLPLMDVVDTTCQKNCLKIQIRLSPDVEPITAFSVAIHGEQYQTDLPIMRFVINPAAYIYPYSLLKNVLIKEIEIAVDVKGVRDMVLYNYLGKLDPNSPFAPFGTTPAVGAYLIVGTYETARKNITDLCLNVEWGGLPSEEGGFAEYYRAYDQSFGTHLFEASITALKSGRWQPYEENARPRVKLFKTQADVNPGTDSLRIKKNSRLSCKAVTKFMTPIRNIPAGNQFAYDSRAAGGFFRITLTAPEYAFGHRDYPNLLTNVLSANAHLKKPKRQKPVPNLPYTPNINSVSIHYKAIATATVEHLAAYPEVNFEERLYHIHPFGVERLSAAIHREIRMLPAYDSDGYLYIGLAAREISGLLTLFFHLREDSTPETASNPPEFGWYYLSSNQWEKLEKTDVMSDTTNGFLSSGIVTVNVPEDINRDNTIMPSNLYWLAISAGNRLDTLCSLYCVYPQALKVIRKLDENSPERLETTTPAGTLKEAGISIPGIKKIDQIVDSFGGRPAESQQQFKTRIGERLRHKNRAVTAWDYERLILERFSEIFKVKCFANMVAAPLPEDRIMS